MPRRRRVPPRLLDGVFDATNGSGVATQTVPAGTYYVREASAGAGFTNFGAVKALRYSPSSSNPSADQPYAARVTITNNTTTDVSPNTNANANATLWDTNSGASAASSPFINVRDNAVFPNTCGLNILLVLDRSGSIGGSETSYANAAKAFVNSLNGTPSQIGIMSFSAGPYNNDNSPNILRSTPAASTATRMDPAPPQLDPRAAESLRPPGNAALLNTTIDNVYTGVGGGTNWDLALQKASQAAGFSTDIITGQTTKPDVVAFITDGNPTARSTSGTDGGNDVELIDLTAGMSSANSVKNVLARGSTKVKLYALGVGSGVTAENLKVASGPLAGETTTRRRSRRSTPSFRSSPRGPAARAFTCASVLRAATPISRTGTSPDGQRPPSSYLDNNRSTHTTLTGVQTGVIVANLPNPTASVTVAEDASGQPLAEFDLKSVVCKDGGYGTGNTVTPTATTSLGVTVPVTRSGSVYCTFTNGPKAPNVSIVKTATTPTTVSAGDPVGFSITATNSSAAGTGTAKNVRYDPLPDGGGGLVWTLGGANAGSCTGLRDCPQTGSNCNFGDLTAGAAHGHAVCDDDRDQVRRLRQHRDAEGR